jgi:23S rRNA (pseudouridine1915-N3)-methyltransferase
MAQGFLILAVGKARRGPEQDLFNLYAERMRPRPELIEVEDKRGGGGAEGLKGREAALLVERIPADAALVALDERGSHLDSVALARQVEAWRLAGKGRVAWVIGGADGLDETLRARADLVLSFGRLTWPHMLVRAMLAEQLYRIETILSGHPYHRA